MGSRTIITKSLTTNTSKTPTSGRYNSKTTTTAKYNSRTSSSTTYTSGTRTPANYYNSRTPSESSANNYDAALQARLEAERKKRIQENKAYIEKIQRTNEEVKEARSMITEAQALLASAVGGVKYGEYSKYLTNQDEMLQQMTKGLNSCGEKAATNIRDDGEEYIFNQTNTNPNNNNTNNNKKTLSANTDKLRELESLLDNISKKTKSIDDTMIGFSNASNRLGITNSGNVKENSQDLLINTVELKMKVRQQIQDIEKTEKENLNIIGRIADWFGNLFKAPDKEQKSQTGTTVSTRITTNPTVSTRTRIPNKTLTSTRTKTPYVSPAEEEKTNIQPKNNRDIAHRGRIPSGWGDNSAEAFITAGEEGFWGAEADVRFDANGNLVCSHNAVKNGENPTSFEEYLDICKEYGMTAIIDLKYEKGVGPADPNLSPAVLKTIQEKGMLDSCVMQTNNAIDIPYIRECSKDARIWYLTDVVTDKKLDLIKENNVECVNMLASEENAFYIKKLTDNDIDACIYAVQTTEGKERRLNMGAKYIMTDKLLDITPYQEGEEDVNDIKGNSKNEITEGLETDRTTNQKTPTSPKTPTSSRTPKTQTAPRTPKTPTNPTTPTTKGDGKGNIEHGKEHCYFGHATSPDGYDETWYYDLYDYNDLSGVVRNLENHCGYSNLVQKVREDGVFTLSGTKPNGENFEDLVIIAADIAEGPASTFERGDYIETSHGLGIVVDKCGSAVSRRKANPNDITIDIATGWMSDAYNHSTGIFNDPEKYTVYGKVKTEANETIETPITPTEPKTPTTPTKPTTPTEPKTPTTPTKPTTPTNAPTKPSINEPENTQPPVMQRTPEAILEAVQNIEDTENSSEYICKILHLSGFFTEEEMNTYKSLDISEICNQLEERGWNTITNSSELKSGDIIIVNNGEEIRVYAGNNSWYKEGTAELQQGNENWNENISWVAYRAN